MAAIKIPVSVWLSRHLTPVMVLSMTPEALIRNMCVSTTDLSSVGMTKVSSFVFDFDPETLLTEADRKELDLLDDLARLEKDYREEKARLTDTLSNLRKGL